MMPGASGPCSTCGGSGRNGKWSCGCMIGRALDAGHSIVGSTVTPIEVYQDLPDFPFAAADRREPADVRRCHEKRLRARERRERRRKLSEASKRRNRQR